MRNAQPWWRRYLWLTGSAVFAVNGVWHAFSDTSPLGSGPVRAVFVVGFCMLAVMWLRNFLVTVNRRSDDGRRS